jgi:hypothetical protein
METLKSRSNGGDRVYIVFQPVRRKPWFDLPLADAYGVSMSLHSLRQRSIPLRKDTLIILGIMIAILFFPLGSRAQSPPLKAQAADYGLALTPPMGWYPWNEFGEEPQNEKLIKEIVDVLVSSGLKEAGYVYVGPVEPKVFSIGFHSGSSNNGPRAVPACS